MSSVDNWARRFGNILDTIGNTPLVKINHLNSDEKKRNIIEMLENAEMKGELKPGYTIVKTNSKKEGLYIAMMSDSRTTIVMPLRGSVLK